MNSLSIAMLLLLFKGSVNAYAYNIDQLSSPSTVNVQCISSKNRDPIKDKIELAIEAQDHAEIYLLLGELEKRKGMSELQYAILNSYIGQVCYSINDFECFLVASKKVIEDPSVISDSWYTSTLYKITQVYFVQEKYNDALHYAQRFFDAKKASTSEGYILLGTSYYLLEQYDKTVFNVLAGIQKEIDNEGIPKESWLNLLAASYRNNNQLEKVPAVLELLIEYYPTGPYQRMLKELNLELDTTQ